MTDSSLGSEQKRDQRMGSKDEIIILNEMINFQSDWLQHAKLPL